MNRTACNHTPHFLRESCTINHCNMDDKEQKERIGSEEMNRPCRLVAAQDVDQTRQHCAYGRRHGQTACDHQWKKHKNDGKVGQPLEDVVGLVAAEFL